jgi:hypothetical protein
VLLKLFKLVRQCDFGIKLGPVCHGMVDVSLTGALLSSPQRLYVTIGSVFVNQLFEESGESVVFKNIRAFDQKHFTESQHANSLLA